LAKKEANHRHIHLSFFANDLIRSFCAKSSEDRGSPYNFTRPDFLQKTAR